MFQRNLLKQPERNIFTQLNPRKARSPKANLTGQVSQKSILFKLLYHLLMIISTLFISIAVFHHFPSKKYREDVAKELYRVTKKDGHIIITVWNLYQKRYIKNIVNNWLEKLYFIFAGATRVGKNINSGKLDWNDCYISFTDNEVHPVKSAEGGAKQFSGVKKFQRFHHAFTKRELKKLFSSAGFEIEKCETINGRNIVLIGKK